MRSNDFNDNMSVGKRIRELRKRMHLTQEGLGLRVPCDTSTISKLETDKKSLDYATAQRLAAIFGVTTEFLYHGNKNTQSSHILDLSDLPIEQVNLLKQIADIFRKVC